MRKQGLYCRCSCSDPSLFFTFFFFFFFFPTGEQLEASIEEVEAWVQQHGEEAKLTEIKLKRSKLSTAITKVSR